MPILCYGGSFNPIHHAHLLCAQAVAERQGYDKVLLIPSAVPPHRQTDPDMAVARDRLTMCHLAVDGHPLFDVSDVELKRDSPSYTLETAFSLQKQGLGAVHWLIGGDTVPRLHTWHRASELMEVVQFVVMHRPDAPIDWLKVDPMVRHLRQTVVPAPLIDISASEVRQRVRLGQSIRYHVPPSVAEYIATRNLYR